MRHNDRRIRTIVQFPIASLVLRYRAAQVFGNASKCAAAIAISRQALNQRLRSASKWDNTHAWWCALLAMPVELLAGDDIDAVMPTVRALPVPSIDDRAKLAADACAEWPHVVARSYKWPDAHKATRDARVAAHAVIAADTATPSA